MDQQPQKRCKPGPVSRFEVGYQAGCRETADGKYHCNWCPNPPFSTKWGCIKHLNAKHRDKMPEHAEPPPDSDNDNHPMEEDGASPTASQDTSQDPSQDASQDPSQDEAGAPAGEVPCGSCDNHHGEGMRNDDSGDVAEDDTADMSGGPVDSGGEGEAEDVWHEVEEDAWSNGDGNSADTEGEEEEGEYEEDPLSG
jgi:hypothetical protein